MAEPGLKVSASSLLRAGAGSARNPNTLARLQALDKNGDGQLDLDEMCDAIDEIVRKEKTERTLKWLVAALAVFSLLTIAATVGLTYAVVSLSKDTQVDGSVLASKDTGEALRTGSFLESQNATALAAAVAASNDPGAVLGRVKSIKVPSLKDGEAYTVYKVDSVTMLLNGSALVRTATGLDILMPVESVAGAARVATQEQEALNTMDAPQSPGRKLMQTPPSPRTPVRLPRPPSPSPSQLPPVPVPQPPPASSPQLPSAPPPWTPPIAPPAPSFLSGMYLEVTFEIDGSTSRPVYQGSGAATIGAVKNTIANDVGASGLLQEIYYSQLGLYFDAITYLGDLPDVPMTLWMTLPTVPSGYTSAYSFTLKLRLNVYVTLITVGAGAQEQVRAYPFVGSALGAIKDDIATRYGQAR